MKPRTLLGLCLLLTVGAVAASAHGSSKPAAPLLFDDFSYTTQAQLERHGWIVRSEQGWPGVAGASWPGTSISFVADPARSGNRLMRLTASTDGSATGTSEAQVCQQRKFRDGTYATRIRWRDEPTVGSKVDQVVEAFYAISPLVRPLDPNYSEMDWEYLPNGGWGSSGQNLYVTTWETARLEPWYADNMSSRRVGSEGGWHTLVLTAGRGTVSYWLDGAKIASHGGRYYPEVPMSINYNLWFIADGLAAPRTERTWQEDVDWVLFEKGKILSPRQVVTKVAQLRAASVRFRDTVPAAKPALPSPCNF